MGDSWFVEKFPVREVEDSTVVWATAGRGPLDSYVAFSRQIKWGTSKQA